MRHGSTHYLKGCRCRVCTVATRFRERVKRHIRAARLRRDPSLAPHGRVSTYRNWECRCRPCTEAANEASRTYKRSRRGGVMWDSVCCSAPMTEEIGPSHNGRGRATRTCSACEAEYSAEVERWTPAEIRRRVAVVLGRAVSL